MLKFEKFLLYCLPKKIAHKLMYRRKYHKKLDLDNPTTIDEKIHWLIINEFGSKETLLTDKVKVREYIKDKGLEEILIDCYGTYDNASEIDFESLPDKYVIKPNNCSGVIVVCLDKKNLNKSKVKKTLNKALRQNYAIMHLEYHYKNIIPKLICEKYIGKEDGTLPVDYKFLCFNGEPKCIMYCSERESQVKYDYYDLNWNYLNYSKDEYKCNKEVPKPNKLKEMIEIARKLSNEFKIVRVDLYEVEDKIYFGELTFTPVGGSFYFNNQDSLLQLGNYLKLN